jgi:hypothetical protein
MTISAAKNAALQVVSTHKTTALAPTSKPTAKLLSKLLQKQTFLLRAKFSAAK